MTTRSAILSELLSEYQARRGRNAQIEVERLAQATEKCPEIGALHAARQEMIFRGLRMALEGEQDARMPEQMALYNRQIRDLLKASSLPQTHLYPVYDCEQCRDTGYVGEPVKEMCRCLRTAYHAKLFQAAGLSEMTPQTFETYDPTVYSNEALPNLHASQRDVALLHMKAARAYADAFPQTETKDLLLLGQSGVGKTFLLHAIAHQVLERGFLVLCVSAYKLLEMFRKAHFQGDSAPLQSLFDAELLLIDDLGTEPMMENITLPYLCNLINERQQAGNHTVITTNLTKDELKSRYTERLASRLLNPRQCRVMAFVGNDVRKRSGQ